MALHQNVQGRDMRLVLSSDAKPRLKWTRELHERFVDAVSQLGGANKATPKSLMRVMGISGLTLYHLKSHLQKYRLGKNQQSQSYHEDGGQENYRKNQGHFIDKTSVGEQNQITGGLQIAQALQLQMEVQRKLHEQIQVQRHLQLRIEAQRKYLQSVLRKAQETLARYNSSSAEVEQAKVQLSQLVSMVDTSSPSPSLSVLTGSGHPTLKNTQDIASRHTGCSLESSLTSTESSGSLEETHHHEFKTCTSKKNSTMLLLMEMNPAEKSETSYMKRNSGNIYDGNHIGQSSGKRSEGHRSCDQLINIGLSETFDLNSKCLKNSDSGPKAIDLNCNAVEQFTENLYIQEAV